MSTISEPGCKERWSSLVGWVSSALSGAAPGASDAPGEVDIWIAKSVCVSGMNPFRLKHRHKVVFAQERFAFRCLQSVPDMGTVGILRNTVSEGQLHARTKLGVVALHFV
jgi:hypothetical protein